MASSYSFIYADDDDACNKNKDEHAMVQAKYGPCLSCRFSMDLVIEMKKTPGECCWMPSSFSSSARPFLMCAHCGFRTETDSYHVYQEITSGYISSPSGSEDEGDGVVDDDEDSITADVDDAPVSCASSLSSASPCCGLSTIDEGGESFVSTTASIITDSQHSESSSLSSKASSSSSPRTPVMILEVELKDKLYEAAEMLCHEQGSRVIQNEERAKTKMSRRRRKKKPSGSVRKGMKQAASCRQCLAQIPSHTWRFCPTCGVYLECEVL